MEITQEIARFHLKRNKKIIKNKKNRTIQRRKETGGRRMLLVTVHKDQTVKMFGESRDVCRWVRLLGV